MSENKISNDKLLSDWIIDIKNRVKNSQLQASVKVNIEMLKLYWSIGKDIHEKQAEAIWGTGFYNMMSKELKNSLPEMNGFSASNLKYMRRFFEFYVDEFSNRQQAVDDLEKIFCIPWGHQILLFTKCGSVNEALFYQGKIITNGWSRAMLLNYLDTDLYLAQGKAITNFENTLPKLHSDLAKETLKDPYIFDFLTLNERYQEKELEQSLTENIVKFLMELGQGFAFVGRQFPIYAGTKEMYIDLLFYHLDLRCYVVVELKVSEFEPAFIGQLGAYISAVNHQLKKEMDNPTIGLLICKTKDNILAKYSLESSSQPIGISEYELVKALNSNYKSSLPSIEEIENTLKSIEE